MDVFLFFKLSKRYQITQSVSFTYSMIYLNTFVYFKSYLMKFCRYQPKYLKETLAF